MRFGPIHESYFIAWFLGSISTAVYFAGPDRYNVWWKNMLASLPAALIFVAFSVVVLSALTEEDA